MKLATIGVEAPFAFRRAALDVEPRRFKQKLSDGGYRHRCTGGEDELPHVLRRLCAREQAFGVGEIDAASEAEDGAGVASTHIAELAVEVEVEDAPAGVGPLLR